MNKQKKPSKLKYFILLIFSALTITCSKKDLTDPFWNINLLWDKETVSNTLYTNSLNGNIENCVFSYYKEFYVKTKKMDAQIKASLNNPFFEKNNIKILDYSLIAQFKNEKTTSFNPYFYEYFINEMTNSYGNNYSTNKDGDTIFLMWNSKKQTTIKVTIFRDINSYNISIKMNS